MTDISYDFHMTVQLLNGLGVGKPASVYAPPDLPKLAVAATTIAMVTNSSKVTPPNMTQPCGKSFNLMKYKSCATYQRENKSKSAE